MKFIFSPFFGYIIKFLHVACKITNPSHDDIYLRIFVKIFSEGRRQDFSSDHKVFPNQPKKFRMLQMTTSIWEFLYIFSRKDVGRKKIHFLHTSIDVKLLNFTLKDVSRMGQSVIGSEKSEVKSKSSFKSAENRAASSLGVGGHRYTRISCVSKLLWV